MFSGPRRNAAVRVTWSNGLGNGLQLRVSGFDSRRHLQPLTGASTWSAAFLFGRMIVGYRPLAQYFRYRALRAEATSWYWRRWYDPEASA